MLVIRAEFLYNEKHTIDYQRTISLVEWIAVRMEMLSVYGEAVAKNIFL